MKRLTLLFTLLLTLCATAMAQIAYEYKIDKSTGTFTLTNNNSNSTWAREWTSNVEDLPTLKLSVNANNMTVKDNPAGDNDLRLFVGGSRSSTYRISVEEGYYVSSYSFEYSKADNNNVYSDITINAGGVSYYLENNMFISVNSLCKKEVSFTMTGNNKGIIVRNFKVVVRPFELPILTTNENSPVYYTILNVRQGKYVDYVSDAASMKQIQNITKETSLFYFTGEQSADGQLKVKIHNKATTNKLADFSSWNSDGADWYIMRSSQTTNPGYAISKNSTLSSEDDSWNDYTGTHVTNYNGNDPGSSWVFVPYEPVVLPKMSTHENKIFYYIKNARNDKFVDYDGEGNSLKLKDSKSYNSYWYFVENTEAENVPEGYKACFIYNAANSKGLENPSTGNFNDSDKKTYYIRNYTKDAVIGFAIYPNNEAGAGWNDYQASGTSLGCYDYDDAGSLWYFVAAGDVEAVIWENIKSDRNTALTLVNDYDYSSYYSFEDTIIKKAKSGINALSFNSLIDAISSYSQVNTIMAEFKSAEKDPSAPAVGSVIQLKNRNYNTYLRDNGTALNGTNEPSEPVSYWIVEEGVDGNVKLKNYATGKYIGQIRDSQTVNMVDEENAKMFAFINETECYAAIKETSGANKAHAHINSGNTLVGWEKTATASQWAILDVTTELPKDGESYIVQSGELFSQIKAVYPDGTNLRWNNLDKALKKYYWTIEALRNEENAIRGYGLKNVDTGLYIKGNITKSADWTLGETPDTLCFNLLTFNNKSKNEVNIHLLGSYDMHANNHGNGSGSGSNIVSYNGEASSASAWYLVRIPDVDVAVAKSELQVEVNSLNEYISFVGANPGNFKVEEFYKFKNEYDAAVLLLAETPDKTFEEYLIAKENLQAKKATADLTLINDVTAGLYRIVSGANNFTYSKAISVYAYDNYNRLHKNPGWAPENSNDPLQYWRLEENGTGFTIKAEYDGNYINTATSLGEPKVASFSFVGDAQFNIKLSGDGSPLHCNGWNWGGNSASAESAAPLTTWDGGKNTPSAWKLIAVEEPSFTYTLNVSAAGWATLVLAYDAIIPANVKCYVISELTDDSAKLTEVKDVLPANTAVVVEAESGEYEFFSTTDAVSDIDSKLSGTLYNKVISGEAYILGMPNGPESVGFYPVTLNISTGANGTTNDAFLNNANRAYLVIPATMNSNSFSLRFDDGITTAVENIDRENIKDVIYTIGGVRVDAITAPGLYIVNGKVVIVK